MTVAAEIDSVLRAGLLPAPNHCNFGFRSLAGTHKRNPHWDFESIDPVRLRERAIFYAERAGASDDIIGDLGALLDSPTVKYLLSIPEAELFSDLINDAYKPKMHKMYSEFYNDVMVDFCLNVRKSPFPLDKMKEEDPELFKDFESKVNQLHSLDPLSRRTVEVLRDYFDFEVSEVMKERASKYGVASVNWEYTDQGDYVAIAHGPIEAASNVETSMTQLVQNYTIRAQVRDIERRLGVTLDRTERVANSLGKCAAVIQKFREINPIPKNLFCAYHLPGYIGTSSVFAVKKIDDAFAANGIALQDRKAVIGRLLGTHAHEVMSITAQLLANFDDQAGRPGAPAGLSALLAHLMVLRVIGNLAGCTALPDTFGTEGFVKMALVTRVPNKFIEDMQANFPNDPFIPAGTVMFDLFKVWRLDSGDYERIAEVVMSGWDARCEQARKLGSPPPARPLLMHSNLSSADEVVHVCQLPDRIRPAFCAFGGLADGFLPFDVGQGRTVNLQMASVVMKAVQARKEGIQSSMECAGKLGDDVPASKLQVDPRLPADARERIRHRMVCMSSASDIDAEACSAVLDQMYTAVAHDRLFCANK